MTKLLTLLAILALLAGSACAQPPNYSIAGTGPHHVVRGNWMFFNIVGTMISGTDENVTPSITGLPTGATVTYPELINVCCTTFRYTIAGLNPVRVDVPSSVTVGTYSLTLTYTSASAVVRTASYALIVDAVPSALTLVPFPPNTPLTSLAQWQSNMTTFGHTYCTPPLGGPAFEGFVWYYDGTRNYFQIADYTHDQQWLTCATGLNALYQTYILNANGNVAAWHHFAQGLAMDFTRYTNPADKTAIQAIQATGYGNAGNIAPTIDWLLSRENSYGLETNLWAEQIGIPRIPNFPNTVNVLMGIFDQWFQSMTATFNQPFMVALACEALIQYWDASGDPRVPPLIKLAADSMWTNSWDVPSQSFLYYNNDLTTMTSPDLNLLIAPVYGWVFQRTGDITYRTRGDQIFNAGVAGAYLGDGKHFSQNYRWSGQYVSWRVSPAGPTPPPVLPPPTNPPGGTTPTNLSRDSGTCTLGNSTINAPVSAHGPAVTRGFVQSYPRCTVTVFVTGSGGTKATISSTSTGTPLANPFTADQYGAWGYYALPGTYDVQIAGGGPPALAAPYTFGARSVGGGGGGGGNGSGNVSTGTLISGTIPVATGTQAIGNGNCAQDLSTGQVSCTRSSANPLVTVASSATPIYDASLGNSFLTVLTANITSSTAVNGKLGEFTLFSLCQDSTGNWTNVWPTNVTFAPTISGTASACTHTFTRFDGTNFVTIGVPWTTGDSAGLTIPGIAVSALPPCNSGMLGTHSTVIDSNAASFTVGIGAVVANGGATVVPVFCDGTNWRIG